ncbi:AAA family ATPase [Desulfocurvibacter africanus]|uniref:Phage transposition protein B n=1 Tax=Desulfocurvibacter africanus subsp. africanus str. Walvis Bay TaxID=690850 RepID=F3YVY7_DESAF|nr:ATP-binding protein [Desulfocurvibacter africanus]EGJ49017.1 phage transposition protein B [Desulfocurvibacter africanus subsp. africanus str. Walvis Bay]
MTNAMQPGNGGTIAPLRNVGLFHELVGRVTSRPAHLPGMATFHGFSGYGKTFAATYAANRFRAKYVEIGESWTKRKLCSAILAELGVPARGTIADMVEKIIEALAVDQVPLIIDEADHLCGGGMVELVREIHDKSGAAIVLIGEELLPDKLAKWERVHNRMLDWVPAQPADLDDVRHLARLYCSGLEIGEDLLAKVAESSQGRVRRACVNLERIRERAATEGQEFMGLAQWGSEALFSGRPPARRL